jgi:uncharacterized membrane protein YgdD (TMEM256/DUF423 family)
VPNACGFFAGRLAQASLQLVHFWLIISMQLAIQIAGVLGFLGVALGAFGAHQLAGLLAANQTSSIWQTAVLYHLVHAVAALWAAGRSPTVVWIWAAGIVIFSGSLYLLAITNVRWLGAITPIGGLLFLAGWMLIVIKPQ